MKNKYKILFVSFILSFLFILSSCGKKNNKANDDTTITSVESTNTSTSSSSFKSTSTSTKTSTSTSTSTKTSTSTSTNTKTSTSASTSTSTVIKCTVTFKIDFVSYTKEYNKGDKILKPSDSNREGYRNDGWYYNDHKWDFDNDVVEDDMTLQVKFIKLCNVTFNFDNGTDEILQTYDENSLITKPNDPTKEGYSFDGWYHGDTIWDFNNDKIQDNITLKAKWTKLALTCVITAIDSNKGSVSGASTSTYDYNSTITIEASPNEGYIFVHWINLDDNSIVSTDKKYTFSIKSNVNYIAVFEDDEKVNYKVNYYFQNVLDNEYTLDEDLSYTAKAPRNSYLNMNSIQFSGFTFPMNQRKQIKPDGTTTFDFYYDRLKYNVYLSTDFDGGAGSYEGDDEYRYGQTVSITASSSASMVEFVGWYKGSLFITDDNPYTFTMPAENVTLCAMFKQTKYKLTYESLIPGIRVQAYVGGTTNANRFFDEYVEPGKNITFLGLSGDRTAGEKLDWIINGEKYTGYSYTLKMPEKDTHLIIQTDKTYFTSYTNYYFGSYPQTQVTNEILTAKLNDIAGLPSTNNKWVSYGYYELSQVSNYMYYIDIDIDNNNILDYRGVYFYHYRPDRTQNIIDSDDEFDLKYTYQDDYGFQKNTVYWFSYDLIQWFEKGTNGDNVELYSYLILDAQEFNHYYKIANDEVPYEHNGGEGFSNSYLLSDLRKWLQLTFYQTAFSSEQKQIINATAVQNSGQTAYDYVYLFSKDTAPNGNSDRSDYAKCQGVDSTGDSYWTTSSYSSYGKQAYYMKGSTLNHEYVSYSYIGVRPVITIKTK